MDICNMYMCPVAKLEIYTNLVGGHFAATKHVFPILVIGKCRLFWCLNSVFKMLYFDQVY